MDTSMLAKFGCIGLVLIAVVSILAAVPTCLLWNWLCPTLFGLKTITLTQAWGLNFLCGILFKGGSSNSCKESR